MDLPAGELNPLPSELLGGSLFSMDIPHGRLLRFWGVQLNSLDRLIPNCELAQSKWGARVRPEIRPAAGEFRTVAISQLTNRHGLGGPRWIAQLAFVFPITGHRSQLSAYEEDGSERDRLHRSEIFGTSAARSLERAAKSGYENSQRLWGASPQQVEKGWLLPPHSAGGWR